MTEVRFFVCNLFIYLVIKVILIDLSLLFHVFALLYSSPRPFLQVTMSSPEEVVSSALSAAVSAAMAVAMAVDAKAELAKLLDEWEEAQQGTTEELVSILTKWAVTCHFFMYNVC